MCAPAARHGRQRLRGWACPDFDQNGHVLVLLRGSLELTTPVAARCPANPCQKDVRLTLPIHWPLGDFFALALGMQGVEVSVNMHGTVGRSARH